MDIVTKRSVNVKIKKMHEDAVVPFYAHETDAGMDLTAVSVKHVDEYIEYDTGLAFAIPEGYVGLLFPRSSVSEKSLSLANSVGVVDAGFRDSVTLRFKHTACSYNDTYNVGERVGQMIVIPFPKVSFTVVDELDETERGTGGYGSTDAKFEAGAIVEGEVVKKTVKKKAAKDVAVEEATDGE